LEKKSQRNLSKILSRQNNNLKGQHYKEKNHRNGSGHAAKNSLKGQTRQGKTMTGAIMTTGKGLGFVNDENDSLPEDILIEAGNLNTALNGDSVEFRLDPPLRKGERQTGKVLRVLKRAKTEFIGVIEIVSAAKKDDVSAVFMPDDYRVYADFSLKSADLKDSKTNDKVQVRLLRWVDPKKSPEGEVIRVLGHKGEHNVEMESIVLDKGFDTRFPAGVEREATDIERNKAAIMAAEIATICNPPAGGHSRRDFRDTLTFTIDPVDAKDFDDAISFKEIKGDKAGNALYEIGIHIADVSHYVREGNALDREALRRGSSVYLVDRTVPMLPEALSNDVCSLNPNEDKLTFSAVFVMDQKGAVHERWFGRTIINSDKRFTYESAQQILNEKKGDHFNELDILNGIAKTLLKKRQDEGAIEFDQDEIKFKLDDQMRPVGVYRKERTDTHGLVEEYMLLANREVAKFIYDSMKKHGGRDTGAIYRIHDAPDQEKIVNLGILVRALGHYFPETDKIAATDLNAMLKSIAGTPEASLVKTATVRSMSKAIYSTRNIGHFGLSFPFYTHFTSPIRRYPDLLVHRILANHLYTKKFGSTDIARYEKIALQSTEREIAAAEAERASVKYKQVEYMQGHVGETFNGIISGVTEWGMYVEEAETRCEGMIPLRSLSDDYYELDKKTYSLIGQKTKKRFRLGDKVRFKVIKGDLERKILDYALAEADQRDS
jgi:ribonuclease R